MKKRYSITTIIIIILYFLRYSNVGAQSHVWLFVDVPTPVPKESASFTTDLKIAAWKGNPGASDFTISFDTKVLKITNISIPQASPFFPNTIIDSLSKSGEVHIASFKSADGISWDKTQTIGTITWFVSNPAGAETDINVKIIDQVISGWNSVDVESFGQHIEFKTIGIESIPEENNLIYNYPNPFSSSTSIDYHVSAEVKVFLTILDMQGKLIAILVNQKQSPGHYKIGWNGIDNSGNLCGSGLYICNMIAGDFKKSIKLLLLR